MAQKSLIQVRVDDTLKESADTLFNDLGIDTPTAIRMFLMQAVLRQGIPFAVSKMDTPNEETRKAIENVRNGRGISKGFSSVKDLMEDLNADD